MSHPTGRFDDLQAGTALLFGPPRSVLQARVAADVRPVLDAVDAATRRGAWAYGFVGYEAASGLDPSLPTSPPDPDGPPLVWFALTDAPGHGKPVRPGDAYTPAEWTLDVTPQDYRTAVEQARARIAAGDTYQVNLTARLRSTLSGSAEDLYRDLLGRQTTAHAAYLDTGSHRIASASPELFLDWTRGRLLTRPMKGTRPRLGDPVDDAAQRSALESDPKERAENVIVVDLLRNDLARIARTGSVRVDRLCAAERYETVWQLTSDVSAEIDDDTSISDLFAALFPSGSVTGAPKPSTMRIITELEGRPRGVYCGAIGWVAPPGAPTRARFNVAIRTAVVDVPSGSAVYGAGCGITWPSDPDGELAELHAKTRILEPEFVLFETMGFRRAAGVRNLERHLARLASSAARLGFAFDGAAARQAIAAAVRDLDEARVRLALRRDGWLDARTAPLPAAPTAPVTLWVDDEPVRSTDELLRHKTTRRDTYTRRAARWATDDVVLVNEHGRITETTIANVAVRLEGAWWTPPVSDGCLPGVERGRLVAEGVLRERGLTVADLYAADELAVVNSLRGWRTAVLPSAGAVDLPAARPGTPLG